MTAPPTDLPGTADTTASKPSPGEEPKKREFKDLPITAWTASWSTGSIQRALDAHDQGMFMLSSQLAEQVQRDDRVATGLNTRAKGLMGLPVVIKEARHANVALAEEAAKRLRAEWLASNWKAACIAALRWLIMMGFALIELVWCGDADRWTFEFKVWHPQFVWFNWQTRRFVVNTAEGPVEITPGDGKWVLLSFEGDYRAWMNGAVRSVAIPWLGRQYAFRDSMRFNEVYGLAIRKGIVPAVTAEPDKDRFFDELSNLGSEPTIICPQKPDGTGYDVQLVESTSTGFQTFGATTADCDKRITLVLNGQNLTTEVKGGSFAAATVHQNVLQDYIEADESALMGGLMRHAFRIWALYNFGDASLAPSVRLDTTPPENQVQRADTLAKAAQAIVALNGVASKEVDMRALLKAFAVPLLSEREEPDDTSSPIFQYHLEYGIVTVNEARAGLGLPPVPDGDVPPVAAPTAGDPGDPASPPPAAASRGRWPNTARLLARLARGETSPFPSAMALLEQLEREAGAAAAA